MLTWRELWNRIPEEWKDSDISVFDNLDSEYYSASELGFSLADDVLDTGHPYIMIGGKC